MKKFLLTSFVILSLGVYTLAFRRERSGAVLPPPSLTQNVSPSPSATATSSGTRYKDGIFTGSAANAYYGDIQVAVTIQNGKLTAVKFLQYPNDQPNSVSINSQAMPYLQQEAIQAQSAQIDGVTGATDSSQAFIQSLSSALSQAAM